jgi:hypothetical protein
VTGVLQMSGLKINYHKCEAYCFGMNGSDSWRIANMLNCSRGSLPMKYLGIPLSDTKLGMCVFADLVRKVAKRVPRGKVSTCHQGPG